MAGVVIWAFAAGTVLAQTPGQHSTAGETTALYMVIDLSEGPTASSYPVSYMNSLPPGGWTDEYKTTKLVMTRIPAGTSMMGSPEDELGRISLRETQREVTLTKDFYIGVFPVTQKQWERIMGNWPSHFDNPAYRDSRPVEQVRYYEIRENPNNSPISPNWPESSRVHADSFMGRLLRTKLEDDPSEPRHLITVHGVGYRFVRNP